MFLGLIFFWFFSVEHYIYIYYPEVCLIYKSSLWPSTSLEAETVNNLPIIQETRVWSLGQEASWRRKWQPTLIFLPGEFHGQRSVASYIQSPGLQIVGYDWATNTFTFTTSLKCLKPFILISSSPGPSIYACTSPLVFLSVILSWFSFLSLKLYILHCHLLILHHNLFFLLT